VSGPAPTFQLSLPFSLFSLSPLSQPLPSDALVPAPACLLRAAAPQGQFSSFLPSFSFFPQLSVNRDFPSTPEDGFGRK